MQDEETHARQEGESDEAAKRQAVRGGEQGDHRHHHQEDEPDHPDRGPERGQVAQGREQDESEHHDPEGDRVAQPLHAGGIFEFASVAYGLHVRARNEGPHGEVDRDAEPVGD